jgi:hypothetical protein
MKNISIYIKSNEEKYIHEISKKVFTNKKTEDPSFWQNHTNRLVRIINFQDLSLLVSGFP